MALQTNPYLQHGNNILGVFMQPLSVLSVAGLVRTLNLEIAEPPR